MDTTPKREHIYLFAEAIKVLMSKGYFEIKKIPLRKYPKSQHLEVYECRFAELEANHVFQISSALELVREGVLNKNFSKSLYYCFFLNQIKPKEDFVKILGKNLFVDFCKHKFIVKKRRFRHFSGEYFHLCNSVSEPSRWEKELGIERYKHMLLKVCKKSNKTRSGWISYVPKGDERFRFAF